MDISVEESGGVTIVRLNGSLDGRTVASLRDRLSALLTGGATRFVIDAAQLRFVDSMGLGALIYLRRMARQSKGDVRIASAGRELLEILDISGLGQMFEVVQDVAAAVARFSPPAAQ